MLIKEYHILLPMSLEEYQVAQLYMIQVRLGPGLRPGGGRVGPEEGVVWGLRGAGDRVEPGEGGCRNVGLRVEVRGFEAGGYGGQCGAWGVWGTVWGLEASYGVWGSAGG